MAITAGALIGFWISQRKTNELQAENTRLRDELGHLTIEDPAKIYVRQAKSDRMIITLEKLNWRVRLPVGARYKLCCQTKNIPEFGPGRDDEHPNRMELEVNKELQVVARYMSNGLEKLNFELLHPNGSWHRMELDPRVKSLDEQDFHFPPNASVSADVTTENKAFNVGDKIVLYRGRVIDQSRPHDPSPGLLLWIEPFSPNETK